MTLKTKRQLNCLFSILIGFGSAWLPSAAPAQEVTPAKTTGTLAEPGSDEIQPLRLASANELPVDSNVPVVPVTPMGDQWINQSISDDTVVIEYPEDGIAATGDFLAQPTCQTFAYRWEESEFSWLPASGDNLGWITLGSSPYTSRHKDANGKGEWTHAINIHWLNGPEDIHLPPRVYDFVLGYQKRERLAPRFSYDAAASVGVYSDFEDSARDGVRFVSHLVGNLDIQENLSLVFGVDYLDRDDLALLPVIGFSWQPQRWSNLQVDAIFPRPEISLGLDSGKRLYLRGLLGGGSWDIEFPDESNDVMTYRDVSLLLGLEKWDGDQQKRWEIGYTFERQLEFRDRNTIREMDDAFVIRWVTID